MKKRNAILAAEAKNEIRSFVGGGTTLQEFGEYEQIFDRGDDAPVARYLERGNELPSVEWTAQFVRHCGSFDSCGTWGITPSMGVMFEGLGIPAEFAAKMLALLGRADYNYTSLPEVWKTGLCPQTRAEFHACVRGVERKNLAEKAGCPPKSLMRLGWMTETEWSRFVFQTSTRIVGGGETSASSFNGVWRWPQIEALLTDEKCLENPVFAGWVAKRPSEAEMSRRMENRVTFHKRVTLKKLPGRLAAAAVRHAPEYREQIDRFEVLWTSTGKMYDTGDGVILQFSGCWGLPQDCQKAKVIYQDSIA